MLILVASMVAIGVGAVAILLWRRKAARSSASARKGLLAPAPQREAGLAESATGLETGVDDGNLKPSLRPQGKQILAIEQSDGAHSKAEKGAGTDDRHARSDVAIGDGQDIAECEAVPEDDAGRLNDVTGTNEGIPDRRRTHIEEDAGEQSRSRSNQRGKRSVTQSGAKGRRSEANNGCSIDESIEEGVSPGHALSGDRGVDGDKHPALDAELAREVEVVAEGDEFSDGEPADRDAPTFKASSSDEEKTETEPGADTEEKNEQYCKNISEDSLRGAEACSGHATGSDRTENSVVHHPSQVQVGRNTPDWVEGKGNGSDGEPAETEAPPMLEGNTNAGESWGTESADVGGNAKGRKAVGDSTKTRRRKKKPAVYRDRRGLRRAVGQTSGTNAGNSGPLAEARLRLLLDPIQRSVSLSVILMRPEGFPESIRPMLDGEGQIEAFDDSRYDDLGIAWTPDLLEGELRILSDEGQQWLRAGRAVHVFSENPVESGMVSVGSVRPGILHAVVCKADEQETIHAAAAATGSPSLASHENWHGIPDGWAVLSGYRPSHAASAMLPAQLSPLDPGIEVEITLRGGLAIRSSVYAEGKPPRIGIAPLPDDASVTIGGIPAKQVHDGAWEAAGWDSPGQHLIDVVPGPSLTYQIVADPMISGEWEFWDAHPERFGAGSRDPWGRAEICGSAVRGPEGEAVVAAISQPVLIALGERRQAVSLKPRSDVPASVAMVSESPAFLVAATGLRRKQGRIIWLGSPTTRATRSSPDRQWAETVRSIAARRLNLECADSDGERVWRNAKRRARRVWRTK